MTELSIQDKSTDYSNWFGDFIHRLKTHQLQLETKTASKEIQKIYDSLIEGDEVKVLYQNRELSTKYFVSKLVELYLKELSKAEIELKKLSLSTSDERVLVWVEIGNDDNEAERKLIKTQAVVNSIFHQYGFHVESMIVEEEDNLDVPEQYFSVFE